MTRRTLLARMVGGAVAVALGGVVGRARRKPWPSNCYRERRNGGPWSEWKPLDVWTC